MTVSLADELAHRLALRSGPDAMRVVEASARTRHVADNPEKARLAAQVAARLKLYMPHKGSTVDILA